MLQKIGIFIKMIFCLILYERTNISVVKCYEGNKNIKEVNISYNGLSKKYTLVKEIFKGKLVSMYLAHDILKETFVVKKRNIKKFPKRLSSNDPKLLENYLKIYSYSENDALYIMKQILDVLSHISFQHSIDYDFRHQNLMVTDNLQVIFIEYREIGSYSTIKGQNNKKPPGYIKMVYFPTEIQTDFFNHCFEKNLYARFQAYLALLHPIFDPLYDFVFCFKDLNGNKYSEGKINIKIANKKLSYCNEDMVFEIDCCCLVLN
ncbi:hypothetical protein CWI37_0972p0010 [Hamiltosporidium tvaerminnensis]|uniref:Protein kinase domain-containing protein n=1 Tax=Hamiltosporidium tvaerminnensis TaxID=1176355 RepID=A0A4Q9KZS4_9MICR|nr:hypothetical protein CWI37_0972p0010 [Hamiltosporidium tvaerminnensis]